jgi:hypothetical protein
MTRLHCLLTGALTLLVALPAEAQSHEPRSVFGFRARFGGRYDDVRMCVATDAGVKGGPAGDMAVFVEVPLERNVSLDLDLPVFRPVFFGASFDMLQFEPSASLRYRKVTSGKVDPIGGPTLGMTLHYGPDYESTNRSPGRGPSFFALGPTLGGYGGLDFKRPDKTSNVQLGLTAYVTPLFSVDDPADHRGIVIGGSLDASFRFALGYAR